MKRLRELVPQAEAAAAKAQEAAAKDLAEAIRQRAPVKTGRYRDSITAVRVSDRNSSEPLIGIQMSKDPNAWGISAWFTWRFLEFGTKAHAARAPRRNMNYKKFLVMTRAYAAHPATRAIPHIFPTYRAMRKRIRRRIAAAINKEIKKAQG